MVSYTDIYSDKCHLNCLPYARQKNVGLLLRVGSRMNGYMIPLQAARETIIELQKAIEEVENVITE